MVVVLTIYNTLANALRNNAENYNCHLHSAWV